MPTGKPAARQVNAVNLRQVQEACRSNQPLTARRALLDWAAARWPQHPPRGLNALAQATGDTTLTALLRELDRACYAGGEWNGEALAEALKKVGTARKKADRSKSPLAELYP